MSTEITIDKQKIIEYLLDMQNFEDRQGDLIELVDYEKSREHKRVSTFIGDLVKKIDNGEFSPTTDQSSDLPSECRECGCNCSKTERAICLAEMNGE